MKTLFERSFARDLKKIGDKRLLKQIHVIIQRVQAADAPDEIPNLKKMQGFDTYYRIRVGEYRIGIEILAGQVIFVCFLHRKDIYRYFP
jgi:mRNA interferase RelE/StbE